MLHLVHHPDYVSPAAPGSSFRFDKYGLVMEALRELGGAWIEHRPEPIGREWLTRVHAPAYVDAVLAAAVPPAIERRIGFPITPRVARRAALAPGGTWRAACLAIEHGYAANTAGGSHHALADTGAGYCVFNDLAVAADRLVAEGRARRVLVVDLDVHQGDGTAALLGGRPEMATFSIHAEKNFPVRKALSTLDVPLPDGVEDEAYLAALARHLPRLLDGFDPDFVLYQAGVDVHRDDRLGRLALTDAGIAARDAFVVNEVRGRGLPLASALGGGYGADRMEVARRHARSILTMGEAAARYGRISS